MCASTAVAVDVTVAFAAVVGVEKTAIRITRPGAGANYSASNSRSA